MDLENAEIESINGEVQAIDIKISKLMAQKEILLERKNKLKEMILKKKSEKLASKSWSLKTFPWSEKVDKILKSAFNLSEFRPYQLEVINASLSKEDVILIMPTGGGKSLCYQLPALIDEGITLVISPLVSLMEDQIMALKKINYPALMLTSNSSKEDVKLVMTTLQETKPKYKLIYVTPEKLAKSKRFMSNLQKCYKLGRFCRIAVDEVHCCSTWGHDFRPDYNYLGILKDMFSDVPLLGLTATSTSMVTADVQKMLNIQGCLIIKATFNRPNIFYEVIQKPAAQSETLDLLEDWLKNRFKNKSGIIYTTVIKDCEELTKELRKRNIKAGLYHAVLDASLRSKMHSKWTSGEYQVIVATVAFGMGIDKPDVRFVIHYSLSKSIENFYQESGRAGRDGKTAHSIIMYRLGDIFKVSTMVFSQNKGLGNLYSMVNYCLNSKTCRRSLIAEHFDEVWEVASCNEMCDHCKRNTVTKEIDITSHCRSLYRLIENALEKEVQLTALKLIDAWEGKGDSKLRISGIKCPFDRHMAENIIGYLLCCKYLKENFHYTAYSTISYIHKGSMSQFLDDPDHKILMEYYKESKFKEHSNKQHKREQMDDDEIEILDVDYKTKSSDSDNKSKKNLKRVNSLKSSNEEVIVTKMRKEEVFT